MWRTESLAQEKCLLGLFVKYFNPEDQFASTLVWVTFLDQEDCQMN